MAELAELIAADKENRPIKRGTDDGFESESYRFAKIILKDDDILNNIPLNMPEIFWICFDKELALSNFQPEDVRWFLQQFEMAKIDYMMSRPEEDLTFDEIRQFEMMRMKIIAKLKRSEGGMLRERALFAQQHQIRQFMTNEISQPSGGILSKIGGFLGGGKR